MPKATNSSRNKSLGELAFLSLRLLCLASLAVALLLVPTARLEAGPTVCLFKNLTGWDCPGCGMTRALSSLCHGHLLVAWRYNILVFLVFPLLLWVFYRTAYRDAKRVWALLRATRDPAIKPITPH